MILNMMPMYNLIECSDNYSKTSTILWEYFRDKPALANNGNITDFNENNTAINSFKTKEKMAGQAGDNGPQNNYTIKTSQNSSNVFN